MSAPSARRANLAPWLLAITLLLIGGVGWMLRRAGPDPQVDPLRDLAVLGAGGAERTALEGSADEGSRASLGPKLTLSGDGMPIPVGVRLPGPGRLEGRVIEHVSGQGVSEARVDLWALPPAGINLVGRMLRSAKLNPDWPQRVQPIATVASGAGGQFAFEGVRSGNYFLEARAARHVPVSPQQVRVLATGSGGPVDVLVLAGGRVLGRVLRADGRPASGVKVALFQGPGALISSARSGDLRYLESETDPDGRFRFSGVAPGTGYDLAALSGTLCVSHLVDLAVVAGEDLEVELRAREGVRVRGVVQSAGAVGAGEGGAAPRPLAGARVGAIPRGLRDVHFAEEILLATEAQTDAEGRYELANAPPGEFDVLAIAAGHVGGKAPPLRAADGQRVDAPAIVLKTGPMVSGRVVDEAGAPVEGVLVRWDLVDWESLQFDLTLAPLLMQAVEGFDYPRTDADGRFQAGALAGDPPFRIDFFKTGFAYKRERWDPAESSAELEVVLSRGGSIEGIVMDAEKAEPITEFSISSNGRIDTEAGGPGAVNPFTGSLWIEDSAGRFVIPAIEAGKRTLVFEAPGYPPKSMPGIEVVAGQATKGIIVELSTGGVVRGKVVDGEGEPVAAAQVFAQPSDGRSRSRGRRARGPFAELGNAANEAPSGALAIVAGTGLLSGESVLTKRDGSFEVRGLEPGSWKFSAQHRDFAFGTSEPVVVAAGAVLEDVTVELSSGGSIFGRVTDRYDRPLPGAIIVATSPAGITGSREGGDLYQGVADASGHYEIEHMQGGGYFIAVLRGDAALSPMSFLGTLQFDLVTVPGEGELEYDIVDRSASACRVHGQVIAGGVPAQAGAIFALSFGSEGLLGLDAKVAQVRPDGTYEFPGLAPGTYQFNYGGVGGGGNARMNVEVPDQAEYLCNLVLPEGRLSGRVLAREGGVPIESAQVLLRSKEEAEPTGLLAQLIGGESRGERTFTGEDGSFEFDRLTPGSYTIDVQPPRWGEDRGKYAPRTGDSIDIVDGEQRAGYELTLAPAWSIRGRVLGENGAPLGGASILAFAQATPQLEPAKATSDKDGQFELRSLAEGRHELLVWAEGYAERRLPEVRSSQSPDALEIELQRGTKVRVRALDANGQPLAGAVARLVPSGAQLSVGGDARRAIGGFLKGQGMSGLDGWMELGSATPGRYRLEASRGNLRGEAADLTLEDPGPPEWELQITLR